MPQTENTMPRTIAMICEDPAGKSEKLRSPIRQ